MQTRRIFALLLVICIVFAAVPFSVGATATAVSSTTVVISQPDEAVEFTYVPETTGLYHITSQADSSTACIVFAADNTYLNYDDGSGENGNFSMCVLLTAGQTYYLNTYYNDTSITGSYMVTMAYQGLPTVHPLSQNVETTVSLTQSSPAGYYSFTPTVSGQYTLQAESSDDTYCRLYDANWNCISFGDDNGEDRDFILTAELTAGQTYYYEVRYYSNLAGSFKILLTGVEIKPLALDTVTAVTISEYLPASYYSFTPTTSGYYSLRADSGGFDTICNLYAEDGTYIKESDDSDTGLDFHMVAYLTAGETYFYEVQFYGNYDVGSFEILLTWLGDLEDIPLTLNVPATVDIFVADLSVFCTFTPTESGYYTFAADSQGQDTMVWLYDKDGYCLAIGDDSDSSNDFSLTYALNAGETYTYEVAFYSAKRTGTFDVLLTHVGAPQELVLELDVTSTVSIHAPGNVSRYKFVPEVSGYYTLAATSPDGGTYCDLYRQHGNGTTNIGFHFDVFEETDFSLYYYLIAGQTYYFDVSYYNNSRTGDFDILLTYSGPCTPSGKIANLMVDFYGMEDLVLGTDGTYRLPDGRSVYIAVDNREDGGVFILNSYTPLELVALGGEYMDLTYWDALTAGMDEDGYVPLTEDTLMYATSILTSVEDLDLTEEHVPLLFFYDYSPVPKPVPGDVNLDGKVDGVDAYLVVQHYAEKIPLTEEQLLWADVDGNGRVDMADAYTITLLFNTAGN